VWKDDKFWRVVCGVSGWSEHRYTVTGTETLRILGGLFWRMIYPFKLWPYRLANLSVPGAPAADVDEIVADFLRCEPGCYEACKCSFGPCVVARIWALRFGSVVGIGVAG
jgi:hypothetical protein